jgi:hypothetical protein
VVAIEVVATEKKLSMKMKTLSRPMMMTLITLMLLMNLRYLRSGKQILI